LIPAAFAVVSTNPHWACVVGYNPFSLCVIHKEGLCHNSGDINGLMMMMMMMNITDITIGQINLVNIEDYFKIIS
jgi:hypothetical protein